MTPKPPNPTTVLGHTYNCYDCYEVAICQAQGYQDPETKRCYCVKCHEDNNPTPQPAGEHTKEPWNFTFMNDPQYNEGKPGSVCITIMDFWRARKCVNLCAGYTPAQIEEAIKLREAMQNIPDPVNTMDKIKTFLSDLKYYHGGGYDYSQVLDDLLSTLTPTNERLENE